MHPVNLMRLAAKHQVRQHDDLYAHRLQATSDLSCVILRSLSQIISTGLQDNDARSLWNCTIKASHHSAGRVATDARIGDRDIQSPGAKHGLELGWIGLVGRDTLAGGVAGSESHYGRGVSRTKLDEQPKCCKTNE